MVNQTACAVCSRRPGTPRTNPLTALVQALCDYCREQLLYMDEDALHLTTLVYLVTPEAHPVSHWE